jgi:hypothetical protein
MTLTTWIRKLVKPVARSSASKVRKPAPRPVLEQLEDRTCPTVPSVGFAAPITLRVGLQPLMVANADLNGDGNQDIVVANGLSNSVSIFLGDGHGGFTKKPDVVMPAWPYPASTNGTSSQSSLDWVQIGDFNGDGKLDLIALNPGGGLNAFPAGGHGSAGDLLPGAWYFAAGNGDGTFKTPVSLPLPISGTTALLSPYESAAADLNGDGKLDLVMTPKLALGANVNNAAWVLYGNGDGTFRVGQVIVGGAEDAYPENPKLKDVNGDGKLDILLTGGEATSNAPAQVGGGSTFSVFLNKGNGTFEPNDVSYMVQPVGGRNAIYLEQGDFNGDGKIDTAVSLGSMNEVAVFLGNGDGTFQPPRNISGGVSQPQFTNLEVADMNNDGFDDLITSDKNDNTISVMLSNGDGTFQNPIKYAVGSGPVFVAADNQDFNNDGQNDVVTANMNSNTITVLFSTSSTTANLAPVVTAKARASTNPTLSGTTTLTVSATDPNYSASQLTYTWYGLTNDGFGAGSGTVTFSGAPNGTNAASTITAAFSKPDTYTITVVITDPAGRSVTSDVTVNPRPTLTSIAGAVSGNTITLNALGADQNYGASSLTYTWAADWTTGSTHTPPVTFGSGNGTNAAQHLTAALGQDGVYTFHVDIKNPAGGWTRGYVTVDMLHSISLTPSSPTVAHGGTVQFLATALDQSGNALNPQPGPASWTWTVLGGGGTISPSGLYTAPATGSGMATIKVSVGSFTAQATVSVSTGSADQPPTIVGGPFVTQKSATVATLSAMGADVDNPPSSLTYTWRQIAGPSGTTFSGAANSTNAAQNITVNLPKAGNYAFILTITDPAGNSVASDVVWVPTATGLPPTVASPPSATVNPVVGTSTSLSVLGADYSFNESALTYTWSVSGTPPAPVAFSVNGTNAAKNTTATFSKAGTYNFLVTILDPSINSVTRAVRVTVNQAFQAIAGTWTVVNGTYSVVPAIKGGAEFGMFQLGAMPSILHFSATVNTDPAGTLGLGSSNGFIDFAVKDQNNYYYAGLRAAAHDWVIGQVVNGVAKDLIGLADPAAVSGMDFNLQVVLSGNAAVLSVNGISKLSYNFGSSVLAGQIGLGAFGSSTHFKYVSWY